MNTLASNAKPQKPFETSSNGTELALAKWIGECLHKDQKAILRPLGIMGEKTCYHNSLILHVYQDAFEDLMFGNRLGVSFLALVLLFLSPPYSFLELLKPDN